MVPTTKKGNFLIKKDPQVSSVLDIQQLELEVKVWSSAPGRISQIVSFYRTTVGPSTEFAFSYGLTTAIVCTYKLLILNKTFQFHLLIFTLHNSFIIKDFCYIRINIYVTGLFMQLHVVSDTVNIGDRPRCKGAVIQ